MRKASVKSRIVLGLVGILTSLLVLAAYIGIIPDRDSAIRKSRASLAEAVAIHSTMLVMRSEVLRLQKDFDMLVERNSDLLSLGLRRHSGRILVDTGDHDKHWVKMTDEYSKGSQVRVPIWTGKLKWGELEMRFERLNADGIWGLLDIPIVQIVLFMGVLCFIIYYLYYTFIFFCFCAFVIFW